MSSDRPSESAESDVDPATDADDADDGAESDPDVDADAEADDADDGPPSNPALNVIDYPLFVPEGDIDREVFGYFWGTVLIANVAVFALALGPMLIFFRGQWSLGGRLIALGVVLTAWTYYRVRTYEGPDDADGEDDEDEATADADDPEADGDGDAQMGDEPDPKSDPNPEPNSDRPRNA